VILDLVMMEGIDLCFQLNFFGETRFSLNIYSVCRMFILAMSKFVSNGLSQNLFYTIDISRELLL